MKAHSKIGSVEQYSPETSAKLLSARAQLAGHQAFFAHPVGAAGIGPLAKGIILRNGRNFARLAYSSHLPACSGAQGEDA